MNKFYITTAIAYVNGEPHIGFALEVIQADALARYHRLIGDDTYFLTGTDEHGVKIFEKSQEVGMETQDYVDQNAKKFMDLKEQLNLSNDDFVRTTNDSHKAGAKKIWMKMFEKGDIYKGSYKGNYCVGCESFIPEKDLVDGKCPIHMKELQQLEEENYFFKLSKYSDQIKEAIASDKLRIYPESRKKEMLNIIGEEGLHDVSFSRPKDVLPWGVQVPNDENQVMYVWCDALSNYITALDYENDGEKFQKYWPANVHLIGKDILRFHAGIWIGMLLSADIEIPKEIYVHGFVTSEGQKMSKSLGNVVNPIEYVEKYGIDAMRYYLLREIPTVDDGDFSQTRFVEVFNSELANGVGNLVNRVVMMTERYLEAKVPEVVEKSNFVETLELVLEQYHKAFKGFDIKQACEVLMKAVDFVNKYIDEQKPWAMAKEGNDNELKVVLYNLLESLRIIAAMLMPIIPDSAAKIAGQLSMNSEELNLKFEWGVLKEGTPVLKSDALFPRIED